MSPSLLLTILLTTLAILAMAGFIIYFLVQYQKRQLQHIREKDQLKTEFESELLRTQIEIQEETLAHVAREMHDNIGQLLSLTRLYLGDLESPAGREKAMKADGLVSEAVQSIRTLSASLNPDQIARLSLSDALAQTCDRIAASGTLQVEYHVSGHPLPLDEQRNLMLFRICQEILGNSIRHAKATLLTVSVNWEHNRLNLSLADNGIGFRPSPDLPTGQGLSNLQKRASLIGAVLKMESEPGKGTGYRIEMGAGKPS